jgi:glycosyltransferase involved in cell wall biosynthesis
MVENLRSLGHNVFCFWAPDIQRRIRHGNLHYAFELPTSYWKVVDANLRKTELDVVTINLGQGYLSARRLRQQNFRGVFVARSHGLDDHLESVLSAWEKKLGYPQRSFYKRILSTILNKILARHMHLTSRYCDGYCVSNSLDAQWLHSKHGLEKTKIATIPQAPALAFTDPPTLPMTTERLRRLLYVANFHFAKGPKLVAEAATAIFSSDESTRLTWICHPQDHERVRQLFPEPLQQRVDIVGWMPQNELVREFDRHGIFLYPSLFDGFGKVFLEAMARGCCVIGTRAGGMVDIIKSGQNGYHIDFAKPGEIPPLVRQLQSNPLLSTTVSTAAAKTAREHTWQRVGQELASFFVRTLHMKSSRSI